MREREREGGGRKEYSYRVMHRAYLKLHDSPLGDDIHDDLD